MGFFVYLLMQFFGSDTIYDGLGNLPQSGILVFSDSDVFQEFVSKESIEPSQVKWINNPICPGFVNAHCHLELSAFKGLIPKGIGINAFIDQLQALRSKDLNLLEASEQELNKMQQRGVVALGDISNSDLCYKLLNAANGFHTHFLIEAFSFLPFRATAAIERVRALKVELLKSLKACNKCSIIPHAPYSVSADLLSLIYQENPELISVHMEESMAESEFFMSGTGKFKEKFNQWGFDLTYFKIPQQRALAYFSALMQNSKPSLFVHNTFADDMDVKRVSQTFDHAYWCLCPNANLYIESSLPNLNQFDLDKVCIGTDSLASNDQLNLLSEVNALRRKFDLPTEKWIQILCNNGANALGFSAHLGSFERRKSPGLVSVLDFDNSSSELII